MHAAVAKLLKNELPGPEWRCAVHQGCTGQRFFASGRGWAEEKFFEVGQGRDIRNASREGEKKRLGRNSSPQNGGFGGRASDS